MKPHDEWNSTDIADHARSAMHMETKQYGEEPPRERGLGVHWLVWLASAALTLWLVVALAWWVA